MNQPKRQPFQRAIDWSKEENGSERKRAEDERVSPRVSHAHLASGAGFHVLRVRNRFGIMEYGSSVPNLLTQTDEMLSTSDPSARGAARAPSETSNRQTAKTHKECTKRAIVKLACVPRHGCVYSLRFLGRSDGFWPFRETRTTSGFWPGRRVPLPSRTRDCNCDSHMIA